MQLPWIDEKALAKGHPCLFHYTNKASLPLILNSGGLFATEYSKTNDQSEFRALREPLVHRMAAYARKVAREKGAKRHLKVPMTDEEFDAMIEKDAVTFFEIMVRVMPTTPHITCFSMHTDPHHFRNGLLTMWRMYGGGPEWRWDSIRKRLSAPLNASSKRRQSIQSISTALATA